MSVLPGTFKKRHDLFAGASSSRRLVDRASAISDGPRAAAINPSGFEVMIGVLVALLIVGCVGIYFDHLDWVAARNQPRTSYTAALATNRER